MVVSTSIFTRLIFVIWYKQEKNFVLNSAQMH